MYYRKESRTVLNYASYTEDNIYRRPVDLSFDHNQNLSMLFLSTILNIAGLLSMGFDGNLFSG